MKNVYIIGCGGVGAWLAHALTKTLDPEKFKLVLMDGDTIEDKNIDRQLFNTDQIGMPKNSLGQPLVDTHRTQRGLPSAGREKRRIGPAIAVDPAEQNDHVGRLRLGEYPKDIPSHRTAARPARVWHQPGHRVREGGAIRAGGVRR